MEGPFIRIEENGTVVPLRPEVTTIGRGRGVDIRLDEPSVSRLHAELIRRGPYVYVVDLGLSRNGTRVNGRPIARRVLEDGDVVSFGAARCRMGGIPREDIDPDIELRRAVASVDPGVPLSDVATMSSIVERSSSRQRFATLLLGLFAGIALALGIVGIYGVMSYSVAQRQREIGIRMALGASPSDARRMVLREGLSMAAGGITVGLVAALAGGRLLTGLLYGVTPTDPMTFVLVPMLLAGVALLASYLPARRATRVDPTTALRAD